MATFLDRLKAALRITGALESGETPTTEEQTDGLAIGNQMLNSWGAERLMIYSIKRTTHTLIASTNPHTIGSGGNFDTDRPVKIENAGLIVSGQDAEYPIVVVFSSGEYARVLDKVTESGIPTMLYYDAAFPLGKIYLAPVPNAANTLVLYRWTPPLSAIATVGTTIALPDGYEEAFDYNLARRLVAGGFGQLTAIAEKIAQESLARIKILNVQVPVLRNTAVGIGGRRRGRGDILSGWD